VVGDILSVVAGIGVLLLMLGDVFQSVVVPRAVGRRWRVSFALWRMFWRSWPALAWKLYPANEDKREDFLAVFAPFMLVFLLLVWATGIVFGYGLIFWGLRSGLVPPAHSFGQAI
jgi:hypothetical protein